MQHREAIGKNATVYPLNLKYSQDFIYWICNWNWDDLVPCIEAVILDLQYIINPNHEMKPFEMERPPGNTD